MMFLSLFLLAAGAVLRYAVSDDLWKNVNEGTVGMVLMGAGAIGLVFALMLVAVAANATRTVKHVRRGWSDDRDDRFPLR